MTQVRARALITTPRQQAYLVLVVALVAAASGMMFIRMALNTGIPPLMIVAVRLGLAVALFTPFVMRSYGPLLRSLKLRDWLLLAFAGLLFAGDLTLFSESMKHTTVLIATVVGGLSPLWTALLERFVLKVPLHPVIYIGLSLALVGGVMIALAGGSSTGLGPAPLLGGIFALLSGFSSAGYLIAARTLRPRIPLLPYVWLVFGFATLTVLLMALFTGVRFTGYPVDAYLWLLMITVISQLIAHPAFSFVVGYLSPTFISISGHLITVIASIMAFFLFNETAGPIEILGSLVILLGVFFATTGQAPSGRKPGAG